MGAHVLWALVALFLTSGRGVLNVSALGSVYLEGPYEVELFTINSVGIVCHPGPFLHLRRCEKELSPALASFTVYPPPKSILVAAPKTDGLYGVLLFQHGYLLLNSYYSRIFEHVASYGFIVLAPQMYDPYWWLPAAFQFDATGEIADAAALIDWLPVNLAAFFPAHLAGVRPDLSGIVLGGHSRGGKVAFALAQGLSRIEVALSGVVGLDPVDGLPDGFWTVNGTQTSPPVLSFVPHSFNFPFPTLIVGSGLGGTCKWGYLPPCAPANLGPAAFFNESWAPAYSFLAPEYGHLDFLDADVSGLATCCCADGPSRTPMGNLAAGLVVAFLQATLQGNGSALISAIEHPELAPITISKPQAYFGP